jgi:glycerophosphoryl diester phosphodiesterase
MSRPGPRLYAHRGASHELPENTIAAFQCAIDLGADAIETDAHLTRDGHVVLSHDPTGERMCGAPIAIADATLAEVQRWDAGKGHRVPTLEEALATFPGIPFNVDAKSMQPEMPARIVEVVRRAKAEDRTLLASFASSTLRRIRALGYRGPTGLGQSEVVRLLAVPTRALRLPPFRLRGAAAQLPYRHFGLDLGTRRVIDKCHRLGLVVHYWTVNDPALATHLLDQGADGVMTDDPRTVGPAVVAWRAARGL